MGVRRDSGGKVDEFVSVIEKLIDDMKSDLREAREEYDEDEEIDIETCPTQPMKYPDHLTLALRPQIQDPVPEAVHDVLESSTEKARAGSRSTTARMRPRQIAEVVRPASTQPQRPAHLTKLPPPPPPPSLHEVDGASLAFEYDYDDYDDDDDSLTDTEVLD